MSYQSGRSQYAPVQSWSCMKLAGSGVSSWHFCVLQSLAHWRGVDVMVMAMRIRLMSDDELTAERMAYVHAKAGSQARTQLVTL